MKRWELWLSKADECLAYTFFPEDNESVRQALEPDAKLIWEVEAASYNDAHRAKHDFLGWDPYFPMDEEEDK